MFKNYEYPLYIYILHHREVFPFCEHLRFITTSSLLYSYQSVRPVSQYLLAYLS